MQGLPLYYIPAFPIRFCLFSLFYTLDYWLLFLVSKICNFVKLIEKDGGTGPCEVLATCAYKVLQST